MRASVIAVVSLLGGCYLVHERGSSPTPSIDAGVHDGAPSDAFVGVDAFTTADVGCIARMPATVRFEPPIMPARDIRAMVVGADADGASQGVRIHLDVCDPSCRSVDLVVSNVGGGALSNARFVPGVNGTLSYVDSFGSAAISLTDTRRCASCGGTLDIIAGAIVSGLGPDMMVGNDGMILCSSGCEDDYGTFVSNGVTTLQATAGTPVDMPPLHARIASDDVSSCARCDCALPERPATGIVYMTTGVFAR